GGLGWRFEPAERVADFSLCLYGDIASMGASHQAGMAPGSHRPAGQRLDQIGQNRTVGGGVGHPVVVLAGVSVGDPASHRVPIFAPLIKRIPADCTMVRRMLTKFEIALFTFWHFARTLSVNGERCSRNDTRGPMKVLIV